MQDFRGKVAVVTGAASGIGLASAKRFAHEGMQVALVDVRERELTQAACEVAAIGGNVRAIAADVASADAIAAAAERVTTEFGRVHLLLNCAAVFIRGPEVASVEDDVWNWLLGVNLYGAIHCIRSFLPRIRAHGEGGHIVNMASISGFAVGDRRNGVYASSKFALVALSEALAHELRGTGIGVSIVMPAAVATGFYENSAALRGSLGGLNLFPAAPPDTAAGMTPDEVAARLLDGVRREQLYIATHTGMRALLEQRHRSIMAAYDEAERWQAQTRDTA
jgi:NAD(P)-dependent dehydrogenase (short-subunit alcohol dehydrogenase family)